MSFASLGINGDDWGRPRLDLDGGNRGPGAVQPVTGLQDLVAGFDSISAGADNPSLWSSVFLPMEGSDNRFDTFDV